MSTGSVEEGYRRLLRWFPARWRAYREEEVLSVLLAGCVGAGADASHVG
ncbi:hypothetical protein GCM10027517_12080 [Phycicoccus ginsengisoli]